MKRDEKKIILLKMSLYCISLWILMLMLIVLKVDFSHILINSNKINLFVFVKTNPFSCMCLAVMIAGLVGYIFFKDMLNDAKELPVEIEKAESANYENLSFLATYVIPLVCFPMNTRREILVLFVVIAIIGCIFVKTNLYYTNPSLVLLGFNVYSVKCKGDLGFGQGIVIVKGKLEKGDSIKYMSLSDNVYFARRTK